MRLQRCGVWWSRSNRRLNPLRGMPGGRPDHSVEAMAGRGVRARPSGRLNRSAMRPSALSRQDVRQRVARSPC
jgi:hypothetical protein